MLNHDHAMIATEKRQWIQNGVVWGSSCNEAYHLFVVRLNGSQLDVEIKPSYWAQDLKIFQAFSLSSSFSLRLRGTSSINFITQAMQKRPSSTPTTIEQNWPKSLFSIA
jgi:hypothetical protein